MSFFEELRRRNVFRVAIAYLLLGWVVLQAADFALDLIDAPNWIIQALFIIGLVGLPFALFFAWAFELTPEGIKREEDVDRSGSITPVTGRKLDRAIIVFLAAAVALLLADRQLGDRGTKPPPEAGRSALTTSESASAAAPDSTPDPGPASAASIAILPFVNMSADADNEFFSDGVSEEILNVLAHIPELKVAARTSAFAFKGTDAKIADIARELGVDHVLEGSVRKAGEQVRVTAQLIQAEDGFHLWSETYDRELDDIFAIQDEIARNIADALKVTLALQADGRGNLTGTDSLQAYEHYLRGMALWHERTALSLTAAIEEFESALALDPDFAKGWAGLALTWAVIDGYMTVNVDDTIARAKQAAKRVLEIDPGSAEAFAALGAVATSEGEYAEALNWLDRAIAANPSFATAHQWRATAHASSGDYALALKDYARALELDPRSRIIGYNYSWRLSATGQNERALEVIRDVLDYAPEFPDGLTQLLMLSMMVGDCDTVDRSARDLIRILDKTGDVAPIYRDYCLGEPAEAFGAARQTLLSWAPYSGFAEPDSPELLYGADHFVIFVETGDHDAAYEVLRELPRRGAWLGYWLAGRTTREFGIFACRKDVREWMTSQNLSFATEPASCP